MSISLALIFAASVGAPLAEPQVIEPQASEQAPPPLIVSPNKPTSAAEAVFIADKAATDRGQRSAVAVLGTTHLSSLPKDYDVRHFARLLDRLAAWQPRMIAVEALSGAQCDYLRSYAFAYPGTAEGYCPDPEPARKALGLDGPAAEAEIEGLLAAPTATRPPETRPPETRRRLIMLFLAIGEPTSALVQWLRLPSDERKADAVLTADFVATIEKQADRRNEDSIIAAPLAARLGHERVWPVDDHSGDRATGPLTGDAEKLFGEDITALWNNDWNKVRAARDARWEKRIKAGTGDDVVAWYRMLNSAETARFAVASDFAAAASDIGERQTGRKYLAYWETRNLRMVANIRQALGPHPGNKMLAIVGAAHKSYYERYLGVTSDVVIADMDMILR